MKKGFTLIELLVVITIIGILAVIFIPTALKAPAKARDLQRKSDVLAIVKALQAGRLDGVKLPKTNSPLSSFYLCADETTLKDFLQYLPNNKVPRDPSGLKIGTCTGGKYQIINSEPFKTYQQYNPNLTGNLSAVITSIENPESAGNSNYCTTQYPNYIGYTLSKPLIAPGPTTNCFVARQTK